jgi:hypothetical protein
MLSDIDGKDRTEAELHVDVEDRLLWLVIQTIYGRSLSSFDLATGTWLDLVDVARQLQFPELEEEVVSTFSSIVNAASVCRVWQELSQLQKQEKRAAMPRFLRPCVVAIIHNFEHKWTDDGDEEFKKVALAASQHSDKIELMIKEKQRYEAQRDKAKMAITDNGQQVMNALC